MGKVWGEVGRPKREDRSRKLGDGTWNSEPETRNLKRNCMRNEFYRLTEKGKQMKQTLKKK
jgi:hypothetical protein